jgi:hypothetical protein
MRKKIWNEPVCVRGGIAKGENTLSLEESHFIWTCGHILKAEEDDRISDITTKAIAKGE